MIKINNLTKQYGKARGITNVNFEVNSGEIFGFIGPNGAGKSTTIRILLALIHQNSGTASINGFDTLRDSEEIKKSLGYCPSDVNYYDDMTVINLFQYSARFYKKNCDDRAKELSARLDLDMNKKIKALSYGNRKKVAIIQALLHEPKVLIFDEPTNGLDPLIQSRFFELLEEEKAKGTTILFSSHILSEVQRICDRVAIIRDGKILKVETIENLRKNNYKQIHVDFDTTIPFERLSGINNFKVEQNQATFLYGGDINSLVSFFSNYSVNDLQIVEPSLEEVFMHYYEEGA